MLRITLAFGLLLVASPSLALIAVPTVPFEGVVQPQSALTIQGNLTIPSTALLFQTTVSPTEGSTFHEFLLKRARLVIYEFRNVEFRHGDVLIATPSAGGVVRNYSLPDAVAQAAPLVSARPTPLQWSLSDAHIARASNTTDCRVRSVDVPPATVIPGEPRHLLHTRCRADNIRAGGPYQLVLSDLRFTFPNVDESSRRVEEEFGTWLQDHPLLPNAREVRSSMGVVEFDEAQGGEGHIEVRGPSHLQLYSSSLVLSGVVAIPPASGSVLWDGQDLREFPALHPAGSFAMGSEPGQRISLTGRTTNRPQSEIAVPLLNERVFPAVGPFVVVASAGLLLWILYSRLTKPRALENPLRSSIVQLLQHDPGLTIQEVAVRLRESRGAIRHHVAILALQGILRTRRLRGRRMLMVCAQNPHAQELAFALRNPVYTQIIEALKGGPAQTQREVARRAHLDPPRTSRALRDLVRMGMVEGSATPRRPYSLSQTAQRALQTLAAGDSVAA